MVFDGHSSSAPIFADQSERWVGRPVRNYSTIHPPQPRGFDPVSCKTDKNRFLSNLWAAQALCRTRPRHKKVEPVCRALACTDDVEVAGEQIRVKPYWNLWDRSGWTATDRKGKIVVQLTEDEDVPELPLPQEGGPTLVIRLEAMPGAVCKLHAVTNTGNEVLRTATSIGEVNGKIIEASELRSGTTLTLSQWMRTVQGPRAYRKHDTVVGHHALQQARVPLRHGYRTQPVG